MDPRWVDELTGDVRWQKERPWQSGAWVRVDDSLAASKLSDSIKQRLKAHQSAGQSSTGSVGSGDESVLFGAALGASAALVGFGLKGIWKIIVFPFWLMFWMFKLMFWMFKGLFYTFPKFLWSKGTVGKFVVGHICLHGVL
jgi:hypothetical protein